MTTPEWDDEEVAVDTRDQLASGPSVGSSTTAWASGTYFSNNTNEYTFTTLLSNPCYIDTRDKTWKEVLVIALKIWLAPFVCIISKIRGIRIDIC